MISSLSRRMSVKTLLAVAAGSLLVAAGAASAANAAYPDRPVSWVIPFPPGGPTDVSTRVLAEAFSKALDATFVAENKPGASGTIGVRNVMRSKPDGYTIGMLASPSLTAPYMLAGTPYDLSKDIQPIGVAYVTPLILVVNPEVLPNVTDLASLAKAAKNGDLNYTSAGTGSTGNLTMELLKTEMGFAATHIPYQGSSPAVAAVLAGDVPIMFSDSVAVLPQIKAGKLRAIAVNTENFNALPDVKSLKDQGVTGSKAISWVGVFAPLKTSDEVLAKLSDTLKTVLKDPQVAARMISVGAYPAYGTADDMAKRIVTDSAVWEKVINDNKLGARN
ncbi:tripartite tricarboxylate transporter substrate binding protein [Pusillimonas sp. ANT_WB101]|uniref:tripartite tricarboxylate transporter substrate binding protein n=1 Tax=Pusillimonas sp. ANT_WB101 TaxID=2597356 RepID=UPI0011ED2413|nr:tripartite tricarboxylate transporter substrate binding protein [Pusillimonas sp. ANT_WB101]KAA0911238.1 tripartite tricarboxylate transporter substrate binding protein [Pusillimonas sp. ANT_WB101]